MGWFEMHRGSVLSPFLIAMVEDVAWLAGESALGLPESALG